LTWDADNFHGLNTIYVEKNKLWTPDITLYNKYEQPLQRFIVFFVRIRDRI